MLDGEIVPFHDLKDSPNLISRINDHGLVRGFIAHNGAIALQRSYWENFMDHKQLSIA